MTDTWTQDARECLRLLDDLTDGEELSIAAMEDDPIARAFIDLLEKVRRKARN
jgi:hypothetical protein